MLLYAMRESLTLLRLMPLAVLPADGAPEELTRFASSSMFAESETEMPSPEVPLIEKPLIVTQLLPEIRKPLFWPPTVTVAPGAAAKTIGLSGTPDLGATCST